MEIWLTAMGKLKEPLPAISIDMLLVPYSHWCGFRFSDFFIHTRAAERLEKVATTRFSGKWPAHASLFSIPLFLFSIF